VFAFSSSASISLSCSSVSDLNVSSTLAFSLTPSPCSSSTVWAAISVCRKKSLHAKFKQSVAVSLHGADDFLLVPAAVHRLVHTLDCTAVQLAFDLSLCLLQRLGPVGRELAVTHTLIPK
jgi:hypothetical protein